GDALDRKLATLRGNANGLRCRCIVDAESLLLVRAHVRMNPGDLVCQVGLHNVQACFCAGLIDRDLQATRKLSLYDITWHGASSRAWPASVLVQHTIRLRTR